MKSDVQDLYRILLTPVFPRQNDEEDGRDRSKNARFSPNELLGGYLVGPENRLAELATRLASEGAPVFDRPIGNVPIEPIVAANREPSRADVEFLLQSNLVSNREQFFSALPGGANLLFDKERFNRLSVTNGGPLILGYRRFEDIPHLAPLVFYGPSGSGKTRLVEGICQRRRLLEPGKTLYYVSASDFSRALNDAIRREQTELFRNLFNQAGVVAIEDADDLAGKEAAQLEFLPILDAAIKARKLIVITFSKLPNAIPGLLPDLAARLSAGLLIPTNLPTKETKSVAVDRIAAKLGLSLDQETQKLCVERLPSSIGGVCAALVQAAHEFATFRVIPSYDNMLEFLDRRNPVPRWTLDQIVKTVAKYFSVSVVEMRGSKRLKTLVLARQYVAYLARFLTDATFQEIGAQFSERDHSTVLHSVRELEETFRNSEQARHDLKELTRLLNAEMPEEIAKLSQNQ
ncbi:MAG: AAA family ATPase [Thermoguttaceae bacterium]|nr:AAA family ATPase [Thermoguttaceae bacterium]